MAEKKIYIGSGKKMSDGWFKATLKAEVLNPEHWEEYKGNKFIKININLTEPDKFGKTVSITLDKWIKPEGGEEAQPPIETPIETEAPSEQDLPF